MAKLIVVIPGQPETSHELTGNTVTIGRLPDNTIPLPDGSISGHHAKIVMVNGSWRVTDLDSMNKTWVRGVAVREAPLAGEVPIRFGSVHCTFAEGKTRIGELEEQITALKAELAAKAGGASKEASEGAKKEIEALAKQRDAIKVERDDITALLNAERKKVAELTEQAATTHDNQKQVSTILSDTRKQLERALAERDTLRKEGADMASRLKAEKAAKGEVAGKVQATEKEQAQISATLAETKKQLEQAVAERDTLRKQGNDLAAKLEAEKAGQSSAAGRIDAAEKEQARLADELAGTVKQLEQAVAEREALRRESDALAARFEAEKNAKGALADKTAATEKEQARLLAELAEARKQAEAAAAERDAVRKEREDFSKRLATAEEQLAAAESRHSVSEQRLGGIEKELQGARTDLEQARAKLLHLRKERDEIAEAKLAEEQRVRALEEEARKSQSTAETNASGQQAEIEAELRKLRQEKQDLAARLDAELQKISALARDSASARQDHDQLALKLEEAQAQIVDLQSRHTELTSELSTASARHPEIGSILSGLPQVTAWMHRATQKRGGSPDSTALGAAVIAPPQPPALPKVSGVSNGAAHARQRTSPPLSRQALQKAGLDGVAAMRGFIHHLVRHPDDVNLLRDFVAHARGLVEKHEGIHEFAPIVELAGLLDALASDLSEPPRRVETRVLRSLIQGVDTLSLLLDAATRKRVSSDALMQVLMLGCDPQENSPLVGALAGAGFDTEFEADLATGLATLRGGKTGLVCLDNTRLGGDTTALCGALKGGLSPSHPPLLLLAGSSPVAEWARWSAAGVSDFLMKPVHPQELALKTLSLVYRAATGGK